MTRSIKAQRPALLALLGALVVLASGGPAAAAVSHVRLIFDKCSPAEREEIIAAMALADQVMDEVVAELGPQKADPPVEAMVDRWFGTQVTRYELVRLYKHIGARLDPDARPIVAECQYDNLNTFAWTHLAMQGTGYIGFGRPFFDAALIGGFDSQVGTIVHELAHMVPGIAADDHTYEISEMEALADKQPELALDNAQNFEYLVEELYDLLLEEQAAALTPRRPPAR